MGKLRNFEKIRWKPFQVREAAWCNYSGMPSPAAYTDKKS